MKETVPAVLRTNPSPLDWQEWEKHVASHPNRSLAEYVVQGIRDGFRIGFDYTNHRTRRAGQNMQSALEHPSVVQDYLTKESGEGRIIDPLPLSSFPQAQVSRFGVIPKGTSGKWRLILDLSSPEGLSVNDGINPDWCSLSYVTVEDAARRIARLGVGSQLSKVDIKSAYRIVPVHPDDRQLLGMMWNGSLFIDCVLPFWLTFSTPDFYSNCRCPGMESKVRRNLKNFTLSR